MFYGILWFGPEPEALRAFLIFEMPKANIWRLLDDLNGNQQSYHRVSEPTMESLLLYITQSKAFFVEELVGCEGWQWDASDLSFREFLLTTDRIQRLMPPPDPDITSWNRRWSIQYSWAQSGVDRSMLQDLDRIHSPSIKIHCVEVT